MPQFNMDDATHRRLKDYAAEHGHSMSEVLRTALNAFFDNPTPVRHTADARARGRWYVNLFLWSADEGIEVTSGPHEIASTGDIPQLVVTELSAPEMGTPERAALAALVVADLPRLRQVLARVRSTSARIPLEGGRIAQIDVHREAPL